MAEEEHLLKLEQERLLKEQQEELERIEAEKKRQRIEIRNLQFKKLSIMLEERAEKEKKGIKIGFLRALELISQQIAV